MQIGVGVEDRAEAILFERALLALVEDEREVAGERTEVEALDELDHDRQTGLHVGSAGTVEAIAFDSGRAIVFGTNRVEMADEGDAGGACLLHRMNDEAVVKSRDGLAAEACGEALFDVITKLCLFADRARNPGEGKQRVAKRVWKVSHRSGA